MSEQSKTRPQVPEGETRFLKTLKKHLMTRVSLGMKRSGNLSIKRPSTRPRNGREPTGPGVAVGRRRSDELPIRDWYAGAWRKPNYHLNTETKADLFQETTSPTLPCHEDPAADVCTLVDNSRQTPGSWWSQGYRRRQPSYETATPDH